VTPSGLPNGLRKTLAFPERFRPQVTLNFVDADWPPTSVAVTVVEEQLLGTVKVQLKDPVALVVNDPVVQLVIVTPSKSNDRSEVETENPVPETVTVEPGRPSLGCTERHGCVTLNFVEADWPPMSVAVTVVEEVQVRGTLKVQLKEPVALVVNDPL
jgi:hypothetical protein